MTPRKTRSQKSPLRGGLLRSIFATRIWERFQFAMLPMKSQDFRDLFQHLDEVPIGQVAT